MSELVWFQLGWSSMGEVSPTPQAGECDEWPDDETRHRQRTVVTPIQTTGKADNWTDSPRRRREWAVPHVCRGEESLLHWVGETVRTPAQSGQHWTENITFSPAAVSPPLTDSQITQTGHKSVRQTPRLALWRHSAEARERENVWTCPSVPPCQPQKLDSN